MIWIAKCPTCGPVRIEQTVQPRNCKTQLKTGPRSTRQCGQQLTEVFSTRGVK